MLNNTNSEIFVPLGLRPVVGIPIMAAIGLTVAGKVSKHILQYLAVVVGIPIVINGKVLLGTLATVLKFTPSSLTFKLLLVGPPLKSASSPASPIPTAKALKVCGAANSYCTHISFPISVGGRKYILPISWSSINLVSKSPPLLLIFGFKFIKCFSFDGNL
ncbi:hypothetical protein D3C72_1940460 [compost metagenome]